MVLRHHRLSAPKSGSPGLGALKTEPGYLAERSPVVRILLENIEFEHGRRPGLFDFETFGSSITSTPSPGVANSAEGTKYALRVLEGFVEGPRTHPALARGRRHMPSTVTWPLVLPLPYSPAVDLPMTLRAAYSSSGIGSYDYPGRI